ncbi:primosomal protein N' [Paenibacillus sp. MSJ-34]|uniref:primosomal protein N' n=1 Tax=Paenibacillus sp. MSJ-34 TaxID=2841529 RepID=UPI001C0F8FBD|nr:primosomal protein N' [Paenibacillus sp. MSJ-34]MBU5444257.1 primosomal protein N' [Paenibacillus sp. MSJ-34]
MRYAKVIVDVPSKQTNRPFDYAVPAELAPWIEVGSRVGVPFGPRVVQGFVVALSADSDMDAGRVKPVQELLDLTPPLSPDLIELGAWMSAQYVCHEITALQAMIPRALKGKAERYVSLPEPGAEGGPNGEADGWAAELLAEPAESEVLEYVERNAPIRLEQLKQSFPNDASLIKRLLRTGKLIETQNIKDKLAKKTVKTVELRIDAREAEAALESLSAKARKQKEVLAFLLDRMEPIGLRDLIAQLGTTAATVKGLADKGWIEIRDVEVFRDPYAERRFRPTEPLPLTAEQSRVYAQIASDLDARRHEAYLLHGVTGSGKTEVYLQAIERCIAQDRAAIVLVPEISLTPQMVERFKSRFGSMVAVMHSRLSDGERYDEWRKIREGRVKVAIGARSAVFAPFERLGLIIIDEEHETSYKQEESPKYHARDVAMKRAERHGAVVVLGSATPSLESYEAAVRSRAGREAAVASNAEARSMKEEGRTELRLKLLEMPTRVGGRKLPQVHIVDLREELKNGNRSMFSRALHQAIAARLERREQIVLLLNRRGYSTFVMCRTCGYVAGCPDCDISLTYHQKSNRLRCHYCGYAETASSVCPSCGSEHIRYFGTGTQRVEEELAKLFPGIRVVRMDVDTTSAKGAHEKLLGIFRDRKADVLLGTQMVAKGLDFPDVTLVGVITADSALNIPDFRSAEKTFQLLTQVAGRAGRHHLPGEVFVQTYTPEHYSIVHAGEHHYEAFVSDELEHRLKRIYPPYCRLILITFSHEQLPLLVRMSENFANRLKEEAAAAGWLAPLHSSQPDAMELLGPVASPIPRLKNRYRFQCMIKYRGSMDLAGMIRRTTMEFDDAMRRHQLQIGVDVDPQMLM